MVAPATSLPMEFSGPGVSPLDRAVMARMPVYFSPDCFTASWARRERTEASSTAGRPSISASRQYSNSSGKPVDMPEPMDRRSFIRVVRETSQPWPTAPRRWSSGMRTSVK